MLWIDDTAVAPRWLSALAILLADVVPARARLRIIGPYKSDDLVRALDDDLPMLPREALEIKSAQASALFQKNLDALARLRLINPSSTAPAGQLRQATAGLSTLPECTEAVAGTDCVAEAFKERLKPLVVPVGPGPFFVRTIGTDDTLIKLLVRELCARGLADNASGRVILLSEWDSIYARTFAQALGNKLHCLKGNRFELENYPYLRGLDGANVDGAARQVRLVPRGSDKSKDDKEPAIEWPESRDQRDYVRRLVGQINQEADRGGPRRQVRAIGVIGTDVNDKLVLVQALRAAFSDRMLFTTDLDARLLHPEAVRYTRNLIVASSLPLALDDEVLDRELKAGVPPFRDMYQTASFLGARYATADDKKEAVLLAAIEKRLQKPQLYEIGRSGEVELGIDEVPRRELDRRHGYALLAGALLLGLGGFMLWRPAPAMQAALPWSTAPAAPFDLATAIVSGLEVAAWGFALGVVIELGLPGHIGPARAWLMALALMLLFWALVYPGLRYPPAARPDAPVVAAPAWRGQQLALRLLLIVPPLCLLWLWLVPDGGGMREPFAPASGVSAWPSQLLRTLAIVLFAWFLDYTWGRSADAARRIGDDYFPPDSPLPAAAPAMPLSQRVVDVLALGRAWLARHFKLVRSDWRGFAGERLRRTATTLSEDSIWFWRPQVAQQGSIDGALVWREYRRLLRNGPRLGRILLWLAVAVVFLLVEGYLVGGGQPEIPARGLDDRALFWTTILAHVFGTIVLLVLVADVTVLTWRVIGILKDGRTIYPELDGRALCRRAGTGAAEGRRRADHGLHRRPRQRRRRAAQLAARRLDRCAAACPAHGRGRPAHRLSVRPRGVAGRRPQPAVRQLGDRRRRAGRPRLLRAVVDRHGRPAQFRRRDRPAPGGRADGGGPAVARGRRREIRRAGQALPEPDRQGPQAAPGRLCAVLRAAAGAGDPGAAGRRRRRAAARDGHVRADRELPQALCQQCRRTRAGSVRSAAACSEKIRRPALDNRAQCCGLSLPTLT